MHGRLMPAANSLAMGALPLGLAHKVKMARPVAAGETLRWSDAAIDATGEAVKFRREMESQFAPGSPRVA